MNTTEIVLSLVAAVLTPVIPALLAFIRQLQKTSNLATQEFKNHLSHQIEQSEHMSKAQSEAFVALATESKAQTKVLGGISTQIEQLTTTQNEVNKTLAAVVADKKLQCKYTRRENAKRNQASSV